MSKDNLETLFKNLKIDFDTEQPNINHEKRFIKKLNQQNLDSRTKSKNNFWKPFVAIAATLLIFVGIFNFSTSNSLNRDLANVSPEMEETQNFFTTTLAAELKKLQQQTNPEHQLLIQDAMLQLKRLEKEYETLKKNLLESGDDKRVIYAMISNFQNRIDILQNTLKEIETVKQLKNSYHEKTNI